MLSVSGHLAVGSIWTNTAITTPGTGNLHIQNGGSVIAGDMSIGNNSDPSTSAPGTGTVTLSGGSSLTVTEFLGMGSLDQDGSLHVSGQSTVTVTGPNSGGIAIGTNPGGNAVVTVTGVGSSLNANSFLDVGSPWSNQGVTDPATGILNIEAGGSVVSSFGSIANNGDPDFASPATGTVNLSGGSSWTIEDWIGIGGGPQEGHLNISGASNVTVGTGLDEDDNPTGSLDIGASKGGNGSVLVAGAGSVLSLGARLQVGSPYSGSGPGDLTTGILEIQSGGSVVANDLSIGQAWDPEFATPATGTVNVSGGSSMTITRGMDIGGNTQNGFLNISGASTVTVTGTEPDENERPNGGVSIGSNPDSDGYAVVEGGSLLSVNGHLGVGSIGSGFGPGELGTGLLEIKTGGSVLAHNVSIGSNGDPNSTPGTGTVDMSGASSFEITEFLGLGGFGQSGSLNISGASTVTVTGTGPDENENPTGGASIGNRPGGDGSVKVTGAGSVLNVNAGLSIGAIWGEEPTTDPATGLLEIQNGGKVVSDHGNIANGDFNFSSPGSGTAKVTNPNSRWELTDWLGVGGANGVGTLEITDGGTVVISQGGAGFGDNVGGNGSYLLVDASTFTVGHNTLTIGSRSNATAIVRNGSFVQTKNLNVANQGGDGTLTVNASTILMKGTFDTDNDRPFLGVGTSSGGGRGILNLENGSTLTMDGTRNANGNQNTVLTVGQNSGVGEINISGGSTLEQISNLLRGVTQIGRTSRGTLTISDGSLINNPNHPLSLALVGRFPGATGVVNINGPNSLFNAGPHLRIGLNGRTGVTGGTGTVNVNGGGQLIATLIEIGSGGLLNPDGDFQVGSGDTSRINLVGGRVNATSLDVGSGGSVAGTGTVEGDLDVASGGVIDAGISGTGNSLITVTGAATVGGSVNVSLNDGFVPQAGDIFTLITSNGGSFAGSSLSVSNLPVGIGATSSFDGSSYVVSFVDATSDTTAPTINSVSASPDVLWPPNHEMKVVSLTVDVEDDQDPSPNSQIISVTSSDGGASDYEITGDLTVNLRAERSGGGSGRIYTITVESTDAAGNNSTATVDVSVPHDQRGKKN